MMTRRVSLTRCEHCGGRSSWRFIREELYYSCHRQCEAFLSLDLFEPVVEVDKVISVRALAMGDEGACTLESDELPF